MQDQTFKREKVHTTTVGLHIINHITHPKGETTPTQTKDILDRTFTKTLDQVFNTKVIFKIIIGRCSQGMVLKHLVSYLKTQGCSTWECFILTTMDPTNIGDQVFELYVC